MTNQKNRQAVTVSDDFELASPRSRKGFPMDRKEWERLKRMITNSVEPTNWYDRLVGAWFAAVWGFIGLATAVPAHRSTFLSAAVFSGVLALVFLVVDSRERKFSTYSKEQILDYANEIEIDEDENEETAPTPTYNRDLGLWVAKNRPDNNQGVDYGEMPLESKLLKNLTFKVMSNSTYWRAGFKLIAPNATESVPKLLTDKSFLFHVGRDDDGSYGLNIYHNGDSVSAIHKAIRLGGSGRLTIAVERSEKNFVRCFVNDSLEYNERLNPELFKKIFLVAWGDGKDYEVAFDDITYSIE